jgi:hypothetical protein
MLVLPRIIGRVEWKKKGVFKKKRKKRFTLENALFWVITQLVVEISY